MSKITNIYIYGVDDAVARWLENLAKENANCEHLPLCIIVFNSYILRILF